MRREDYRLGPLETMFDVGGSPSDGIDWPGIDGLFFAGAVVVARDVAAIGAGVNDIRVGGIGRDVAALATADVVPVGAIDGAVRAGAGDADGGVVLLGTVDVVGEATVGGDVVELRGWLRVLARPGDAAVDGDGGAAIVAVDDALGIGGIDPSA